MARGWCTLALVGAGLRHRNRSPTRSMLTVLDSRQAIQKYIKANNTLGSITDAQFRSHVNRAIASGEEKGVFSRPKGRSLPNAHASQHAPMF